MFKRRSRLIAFLVSLSLALLLTLPLTAKEKPKPKPEPWQIDGIVAAMEDERDRVGYLAIAKLREYDRHDLKAVVTVNQTQPLIAIFNDKDNKLKLETRIQAIQVLGQLGDPATPYLKAVLAYLKNDKIDDSARGKAAEALINVGNTTHVTDILNFLKDNKVDSTVRRRAASEFSYLPRDVAASSITVFLDFLEDTKVDRLVRYEVASVFKNLGDKAKLYSEDIFSVLRDDKIDSMVRQKLAFALWSANPSLWEEGEIPQPEFQHDDSIVASETVYKVDGKVVNRQRTTNNMTIVTGDLSGVRFFFDPKTVFEFLKDNKKIDASNLDGIVSALENLGDDGKPHIKELVKLLKDKKMETHVRCAAAFALGNLKEPAKPYVEDILEFFKNDITVDIDDESHNIRRDRVVVGLTNLNGKLNLETTSFLLGDAYQEQNTADDERFNAYYYSGGDEQAKRLLNWIAKPKRLPETIDRPEATKTLEAFTSAWIASEKYPDFRADLADKTALVVSKVTWLPQDLPLLKRQYDRLKAASMNQAAALQQTIFNLEGIRWILMAWQAILAHIAFWLALIFAYPKFPQIQAIFFWNPWIRNILGMGYVTFLLQWNSFLRRKLFEPFKIPLLADAGLDYFKPDRYFPQSTVLPFGEDSALPLQQALSKLKGQLILEGASGLGKTMFLRHLLKQSDRITVYLPATKCNEGVLEAIQTKLHGEEIKDRKFLQSLIYSGAIDICIDGLNEVSPDTRAKITQFVESHFRGNILLTTQPLEWIAPATAKTYILQPLERPAIQTFLESRQGYFPNAPADYTQRVQAFLVRSLDQQQDDAEKNSAYRILSNPMDLSIVASLIAQNQQPDLSQLQAQQYNAMAKEYQQDWNKAFPLAKFAEAVYQMRLNDVTAIDAVTFSQEIQSLAGDRFKMVIRRQWQTKSKDPEKPNELQEEWTFRHDKIAEFFIAQTFLGDSDIAKQRIDQHISDPRFRGVYFLLAIAMPPGAAAELREDLIQYAAESKDHSVSDEFVLRFASRRSV